MREVRMQRFMVDTASPRVNYGHMTPAQIIEALGDTGVVAAKLGVSLSVVSNMKMRGIPRGRLFDLHVLAQEMGVEAITVDVLRKATAPRAAA